jgi:hypothetical protein
MYVSHDEVIPTGNLGALLFNRHQTGINCLDSFNAFSYFAQGAMRPLPDSVHVVQGTDSVRLYVGGHLKAFRTASPVSAGYTIVASLESVLGTMDSIKTFTSSSDTFVLSKSFGLLFYRGPGLDADSLPVKLIGAKRGTTTSGVVPSFHKIHAFSPGDSFLFVSGNCPMCINAGDVPMNIYDLYVVVSSTVYADSVLLNTYHNGSTNEQLTFRNLAGKYDAYTGIGARTYPEGFFPFAGGPDPSMSGFVMYGVDPTVADTVVTIYVRSDGRYNTAQCMREPTPCMFTNAYMSGVGMIGQTMLCEAGGAWRMVLHGFSKAGRKGGTLKVGTGQIPVNRTYVIYPNPTTNSVTVSATDPAMWNVSVTDLSGREVIRCRSSDGLQEVKMNVSGCSPGMYILRILEGTRLIRADKLCISR